MTLCFRIVFYIPFAILKIFMKVFYLRVLELLDGPGNPLPTAAPPPTGVSNLFRFNDAPGRLGLL